MFEQTEKPALVAVAVRADIGKKTPLSKESVKALAGKIVKFAGVKLGR